MNLQVEVKERDEQSVAYISGEVDVYTATKLKDTLTPLAEDSSKGLVVDLSDVEYIDSTGLGIFIGLLKTSEKSNTSLLLSGLNDRVRRLFEITGLDEVIDIKETKREEA